MNPSPAPDTLDRMTDIHDIRALASLSTDPMLWVYILVGLGLVGLLMVGIVLWNRRRLPPVEDDAAALTPEEAALAALNGLADLKLSDPRMFYFRLSATLRAYIEARQGIKALEMTTEEFLPEIERLDVDPECRQNLKSLVRSAEPVKFAGMPAGNAQMDRDLVFVTDYIRRMTPAIPTEEDV